ncbi:hypothetical protein AN634_04260 [Lactiplantibacillus plantarum]|uniref:hypothetical protein n=1 Tax=Lactiplantibacillus plantarum TaxID=1590 RepID=UPI0006D4C0B0|nr:hypothetical protein [Lactiplantibacillus plantarum]ALG25300.1 hypothetical protein AN634_04260 [Lactiplantibacillus plantarum]
MKFYRKQPIEAEQFDGSSDLFIKYDMIDIGAMCEERHSPEVYMSGNHRKVTIGDWIITDNFNHHTLMTDEEFKQQYVRLPVINKEVADWIKLGKSKEIGLDTALMLLMAGRVGVPEVTNVSKWIWHYHMADIAIAWAIGYQVEEDK